MDKVFFEINCKLSHTWGPKGKKVIVKNNGLNGKDCVIGAISPDEGGIFFSPMGLDRCTSSGKVFKVIIVKRVYF